MPLRSYPRETLGLAAWSLLLVLLFVVPHALSRALWTDDLYSIRTADIPTVEMIGLMREYHVANFDHPPLYFLILKPFLAVSDAPFVVRLPSLIFLLLGAWILSLDMRRRNGSLMAAATLALVIVLHPVLRHSGICVRMYSLFLLLFALLMRIIGQLPDTPGPLPLSKAGWMALWMAALCYTSYFGFLLGVGLAAVGLAWTVAPACFAGLASRTPGKTMIAGGLGALVLLSPWLPVLGNLIRAESAHGESMSMISRKAQVATLLSEFGGGWGGLVWMGVGWIFLMTVGNERRRWFSLLAGLVMLPTGLIVILTPETRGIQARYLLFAIVILLYGAVTGWDGILGMLAKSRRLHAGAWTVAAVVPALLMDHFSRTGRLRAVPDWWEAAVIIESQAQPHEAILTGGFLSGDLIEYHMEHPERFRFLHRIMDYDPFVRACRDPRVVWYVTGSPTPQPYQETLDAFFPFRVQFEGNQGLSPIRIFSKRLFVSSLGQPADLLQPESDPHDTPVPTSSAP